MENQQSSKDAWHAHCPHDPSDVFIHRIVDLQNLEKLSEHGNDSAPGHPSWEYPNDYEFCL